MSAIENPNTHPRWVDVRFHFAKNEAGTYPRLDLQSIQRRDFQNMSDTDFQAVADALASMSIYQDFITYAVPEVMEMGGRVNVV